MRLRTMVMGIVIYVNHETDFMAFINRVSPDVMKVSWTQPLSVTSQGQAVSGYRVYYCNRSNDHDVNSWKAKDCSNPQSSYIEVSYLEDRLSKVHFVYRSMRLIYVRAFLDLIVV